MATGNISIDAQEVIQKIIESFLTAWSKQSENGFKTNVRVTLKNRLMSSDYKYTESQVNGFLTEAVVAKAWADYEAAWDAASGSDSSGSGSGGSFENNTTVTNTAYDTAIKEADSWAVNYGSKIAVKDAIYNWEKEQKKIPENTFRIQCFQYIKGNVTNDTSSWTSGQKADYAAYIDINGTAVNKGWEAYRIAIGEIEGEGGNSGDSGDYYDPTDTYPEDNPG